MTENNGDGRSSAAANDDVPRPDDLRLDDPCGEAGFDERCRDEGGVPCPFHALHCHAPDYPCLDMLRHQLALEFLEELARSRVSSSAPHRAPR